jgi:hypothetical protein
MMSYALRAAAVAAAFALAGCAGFGPAAVAPGTSMSEARAKLGPPTGEHPRAGGTRLEYATGPFGGTTWMLDFDAQGRLARSEQVLTEKRFFAIVPGMAAQEVRAEIGRPGETWRNERVKQTVWTYRFDGPFCLLFNVGLNDNGRVTDTGFSPDPRCEPPDPL